MKEITVTLLTLLVLVIIGVLFRLLLAPMIKEEIKVDVFTAPSQWNGDVRVSSEPGNSCILVNDVPNQTPAKWPTVSARCMVEGLGVYVEKFVRTCANGNCLNFEGDKVNGTDPFYGMCQSSFCGMTECHLYFDADQSVFVDLSNPSAPKLVPAGSASSFFMRRYGFNNKEELVPQINGTFATFVFVEPGTSNQYTLGYNTHTPVSNNRGVITMLEIVKSTGIDFPSQINGIITLFILMETLTQKMIGLTRDTGNVMQSKILVFYNISLTTDEDLLSSKTALISIDSKKPSEVFKKGLPIGTAIVTYFPNPVALGLSPGYYAITDDSSVSDYITEMNKVTSSLRGVVQDVVELRLKARGTVNRNAFYAWGIS